MDYDNFEYENGTIQTVKTINNYFKNDFYWEMLDYITIKDDEIIIYDSVKSIVDNLNYMIIRKGNSLRYVEIIKTDDKVTIDHNYHETFIGIIFVNFNTFTTIHKKIFINKETKILNTDFGTFNYGDIIKLGKLIVFINSYSEEYEGYKFEIINNITKYKGNYNYFVNMGTINNYSNKNNMVTLNKKNTLQIKDSSKVIMGDLIFNSSFNGIYTDNMSESIKSYKNIGFIEHQQSLHLYKFNTTWYYFGNSIHGGDIVVSEHNNNGFDEKMIFKIKSIVNNIIEWDSNYDIYLNKLVNKIKAAYIFNKPYIPVNITKKSEIPENCIIKIDNNFHIVRDKRIINFRGNLEDEFYYTSSINFDKYIYSDITNNLSKTNIYYYKNTKLYYNEDILFSRKDTSDFDITDKELNPTQEFYYYNGTLYIFPLFLVKSDNNQKSETLGDIKYYYYTTESKKIQNSVVLDSIFYNTDNLKDINDFIYKPLYIKENISGLTKYTYPLYLTNKFLLNDNLTDINKFHNVSMNVNVEERKKSIQFTSKPTISAVKNVDYTYTITTDPPDCIIKVKYLPLWLDISNNIISGNPKNKDLSDNLVELMAVKEKRSVIQQFKIDIKDNSNNFKINSKPSTSGYSNIDYQFDLSASKPINSIEILSKPSWMNISGNKLHGKPTNNTIGMNNVSLEIKDASNNKSYLDYNIFVNIKNPIYFNSVPTTFLDSSNNYSYNLSLINLDSDNYNISSNLPNWLTLDTVNLKLETNGNAINFSDNEVKITITHNDSSDIKTFHNYTINDTSNIYVNSKPILNAKYNSFYQYFITTNQVNFITTLVTSPSWLKVDENNILSGYPSYGDISSNVIIRVTDTLGNTALQNFTIDLIEVNDQVIKVMDGFKNVESNLKPYHNLILNKSEFICRNIIDYGDYLDLQLLGNTDFSGNSELIIPTNNNTTENNFINNKPVDILNNHLNYKLEILENEEK